MKWVTIEYDDEGKILAGMMCDMPEAVPQTSEQGGHLLEIPITKAMSQEYFTMVMCASRANQDYMVKDGRIQKRSAPL